MKLLIESSAESGKLSLHLTILSIYFSAVILNYSSSVILLMNRQASCFGAAVPAVILNFSEVFDLFSFPF